MFSLLGRIGEAAVRPVVAARVLTESGVIRPHSPATLTNLAFALKTQGLGISGGFLAAAIRFPDRVGLVDELGELTFSELDRRGNAVADSLGRRGVSPGDSVAVLIRNHRGFVDAALGIARLGADALYLNTAFAAPQLREVFAREQPTAVVYDQEFQGLIDEAGLDVPRILAWVDDDAAGLDTLDQFVADGSPGPRPAPEREGRSVILTSGTTGTPKGAPRGGGNLSAGVALLSRMPLKSGWRVHIAAPLFHTWGWAHLAFSMLLGNTAVLTRSFDPENALRILRDHRCQGFAVIPVMLQRILRLPDDVLDSYPLPNLRLVASSGSTLPGELAIAWMDRYGDNLHNIYGSTEVAWVSVARPSELRRHPTTAGKAPVNTTLRLYDENGDEVPVGQTGRIFVANSMLFEGYTGGGHKESIDGLLSTGDVGRLDGEGLLFVEGRDDDMIVSGGENVFPQEVENVLAVHPGVVDVATIGVDDEDFGKRLRAFVVPRDADADRAALAGELKDHVRRTLARFKVPRDIVFLDELPRNGTGKILKTDLARWKGEPDA